MLARAAIDPLFSTIAKHLIKRFVMPDMQRTLFVLFISISISTIGRAQDTLPRFSVTARGAGKILISWHNHYPVTSQISIQRSADSLKNFATLLTVPDPGLPENGAVDNKANHPNYYYRLFIVLSEGKYLFTASHRPRASLPEPQQSAASQDDIEETDPILSKADHQRILFTNPDNKRNEIRSPGAIKRSLPEIEVQRSVYVKKGDSLLGQIPGNRLRQFRDSLLTRTKDTLIFIDGDSLLIRPFVPKEIYKVSSYVFTGKYGNVHLALPEAGKKHYSVKFYDDTNKLLFELSAIKAPSLIVDKSNFLHAGWFRFELFEGDALKEKNKLFIPKEF